MKKNRYTEEQIAYALASQGVETFIVRMPKSVNNAARCSGAASGKRRQGLHAPFKTGRRIEVHRSTGPITDYPEGVHGAARDEDERSLAGPLDPVL